MHCLDVNCPLSSHLKLPRKESSFFNNALSSSSLQLELTHWPRKSFHLILVYNKLLQFLKITVMKSGLQFILNSYEIRVSSDIKPPLCKWSDSKKCRWHVKYPQWDKSLFEVVLFQFVKRSSYLKLANLFKNPKGNGKVIDKFKELHSRAKTILSKNYYISQRKSLVSFQTWLSSMHLLDPGPVEHF